MTATTRLPTPPEFLILCVLCALCAFLSPLHADRITTGDQTFTDDVTVNGTTTAATLVSTSVSATALHADAGTVTTLTATTATATNLSSTTATTTDLTVSGTATLAHVAYSASATVTIASGEITPTTAVVAVAGEGAAADTLTAINVATGHLTLFAYSTAYSITVSHGSSANQILTPDGQPMTLTSYGGVELARATTADAWRVLATTSSIAASGGSTAASTITVAASPTNYTPDSADVEGHLSGIDTALGNISVGGSGTPATLSSSNEVTVTQSSDATSISSGPITLTTDGVYYVHYRLIMGDGGNMYWYLNGDTTATHYSHIKRSSTTSSLTASGSTNSALFFADNGSGAHYLDITGTLVTTAGSLVTFNYSVVRQGAEQITGSISYYTPVSYISDIQIVTNGLATIDTGSTIRIFEMRNVSISGGTVSSSAPYYNDWTLDKYNMYLKAAWDLDETSSTRYDMLHKIATVDTNTVDYTDGMNSNAALFTRANDESLISRPPIPATASMVALAWVRLDTVPSSIAYIVCNGAANATSWFVEYTSANRFAAGWYDNSGPTGYFITDGATSRTTGTWYRVGICVSGDYVRMYVNGAEDGTAQNIAGATNNTPTRFSIGSAWYSNAEFYSATPGDYNWDGAIDEVVIYEGITFFDATARDAFFSADYNAGSGKFLQ